MKRFSQSILLCCSLGFAFAAATTACGGGDETNDDDPDPPPPPEPGPCDGDLTAQQFADCFNDAYIDKIFSCGLGDPGDASPDRISSALVGSGYDPQSVADLAASIAAGRVEFDGTVAQECYQQLLDLNCIFLIGGPPGSALSACDNLLVGQVAPGDTCGADFECDDGFCTGEKGGWDIGTVCDPAGECIAYAAIGESCDEAQCTPGSHCEDFDDEGNYFCESGDEDADCNGDGSCDDGLRCVFPPLLAGGPSPVLGTCQPLDVAAEGEACDIQYVVCEEDTLCLPSGTNGAYVCTKSDTAGDPCYYICENGLACITEYANANFTGGGGMLGTCSTDIAGVGDACPENTTHGPWGPCGAFLRCEGQGKGDPGTCENPGSEGDPCGNTFNVAGISGQCNIDLFCSSEVVSAPEPVCIAPQPAGAYCTQQRHCASGVCNTSGICAEAVACEQTND